MNEQNNNIDKTSNNSSQSVPAVKNKFFSADLFDDVNVNDVGSSTNNKVISWGVGGKFGEKNKFPVSNDTSEKLFNFGESEKLFSFGEIEEDRESEIKSEQIINEIEVLSNDMLNDVNGVVYTGEQPEILDIEEYNGTQGINVSKQQFFPQSFLEEQIEDSVNNLNNQPSDFLDNNVMDLNQQNFNVNQSNDAFQAFLQSPIISQSQITQDSQNFQQQDMKFPADSKFLKNEMLAQNFKNIQEQNEIQKQQMVQNIVGQNVATDVDEGFYELQKAYVGNNYQKIQMAPFSFSFFIFGGFYLMYRKMYLYGVVLCLVELIVSNLLVVPIGIVVTFGLRLILALFINSIYLKSVSAKIKNIRKNSRDVNQLELKNICARKGGTNFFGALILNIIVAVLSSLILGMFFSKFGFFDFIKEVVTKIYSMLF